jgi:hypothetical protein
LKIFELKKKMTTLQSKIQKLLQFKGAVAAVLTPYDENG